MQGGTGPVEAQVKWYNARKGFGFVLGPDGQDVFFHASALTEAGIEPPDTGDTLVCEIGTDRQGRRLVTRITELRRGEGGGAAGMAPRRPPFGASAGGFGDRPPRRDFGGGGFGDRPPRRDFGDRDAGGPTYAVTGTVKWFDQVRGFGFVTPEDGGQDVFLHSSVLQRAGRQDVQQGEKVELEVRDGQRGRQAVNLK
jgi:CspA family cold shock protein